MSTSKLKYGFLSNHHRLTKQLELDSLLPDFIAESLITFSEKELIKNEVTNVSKVDKLLTILHIRGSTDASVYERVLKLLADPDVTAGQQLETLVKRIRHDSEDEEVISKFKYDDAVLVEGHNSSLRQHKESLVKSLSVGEVLPQLISRGVVSAHENDAIRKEPLANNQVRLLLDIIERRGSVAYSNLVDVLSQSDTHRHLANLLNVEGAGIGLTDAKYVEEVLKQGHVPPRQKVYVDRDELTKKIREELHKLKDGDGWVVVHGMAGFGKTVLAAEAVRDATLLRDVFPGGVNWLTVGQMKDKSGFLDPAKLLGKLQTLILRLDESKSYRPPSVEAATDYLQQVISKQHPRSLLILDDVWGPEVAQAFAVRCRTMVTSRNSQVAERVYTPEVFHVSVSEGLSEENGRILLAQWLKVNPASLSQHADTILKYCRGSPMAIGLMGAILTKGVKDEGRWKAIAEKLEKKHYHLHVPTKDWNYPTLKASIEVSVESLSENIKSHFDMFVVFDYDTLITAEAMSTIWGVDIFDTEEFMEELVGYSLAQRANPGAEDPDSLLYYIHDIVLDYLKDTIPQQKQVGFHCQVVKRYGDKCNGAFHKLPNDKYIYSKLMGHLAIAANYELLGDLMTQLRWLIAIVQHGDANTYLAEYRHYKDSIPRQFQTGARQFELFLSGHMYVLANQPTSNDIIQLALLVPTNSMVYVKAQAMTTDTIGKAKSWFQWSNKWSDPEKYALKLKLHHEGVQKCCYSSDETKVLSCASTEVKLWDSSTGMVLSDFKGHTDLVTCCDLSPSGKLVVSSSEDCTVKVWNSRKRTVVCDFHHHQYGVQTCAFSPDETLILSADVDSVVMLWSARTGKVQSKWRIGVLSPAITPTERQIDFSVPPPVQGIGHQTCQSGGEGVMTCAFSPDGQGVVTASQNGSVNMWNLNGHIQYYFVGHTAQIRSCVFSRDGSLLATTSLDKTARVWNVPTQECDVLITNGDAAVLSCDLSLDASRLLTGDVDGSVKVWSLPHGVLLQDFPLHWDFVNCVLYSPLNQIILSAADNGLIKIMWPDEDMEEDSEVIERPTVLQYHRRFSVYFRSVGSDYEPTIVCYASKEGKLQVVKGGAAEVVVPSLPITPGYTPRCWVISNTGTMVAVGYEEGMIQVFQLTEESDGNWSVKELWKKDRAHKDSVVKIYFSPKDNKFISCSSNQHKAWLAQEGREMGTVNGRGVGVRPCVFFSDNIRAVSALEGSVLLWNSNTGKTLAVFNTVLDSDTDNILCINVSADNTRLVASTTSGLVVVWDVASVSPLLKCDVMPMSDCARSCALSPNGSLVAAGFDDGSLRIWNVDKRKDIAYCPTESDYWMIDVAFSPDGSRIVTLCDSIEWWNTDGSHSNRVLLKGTFGKYIRFSPNFKVFVTIDNAGLLYILNSLA